MSSNPARLPSLTLVVGTRHRTSDTTRPHASGRRSEAQRRYVPGVRLGGGAPGRAANEERDGRVKPAARPLLWSGGSDVTAFGGRIGSGCCAVLGRRERFRLSGLRALEPRRVAALGARTKESAPRADGEDAGRPAASGLLRP